MNALYHPISCEFHDVLEALATTGKIVRLRFRDPDGAAWTSTSSIVDVFSREGEEFLRTNTGLAIRLDRLIEVDGIRQAASNSCDKIAYD